MAQPKKAKFRVATAGKAIDGRDIKKEWLTSMAKNYSIETRPAYIRLEHKRSQDGYWPPVMGAALSLETREEDLQFGDKSEKRTTLWAEIEANDYLLSFTQNGQKLNTSIEVVPDFNGDKNEFYLGGIAATDDPASFHTQQMQFSASFANTHYLSETPAELELLESETEAAASGIFNALMEKIKTAFSSPAENAAKSNETETSAASQDLAATQFAALGNVINDGFETIKNQFAALEAQIKTANETAIAAQTELAAFKTELESTPNSAFTPLPKITGEEGSHLAQY